MGRDGVACGGVVSQAFFGSDVPGPCVDDLGRPCCPSHGPLFAAASPTVSMVAGVPGDRERERENDREGERVRETKTIVRSYFGLGFARGLRSRWGFGSSAHPVAAAMAISPSVNLLVAVTVPSCRGADLNVI